MSVFKQLRSRRLNQEETQLDREVDSTQRLMEDESYQNSLLDQSIASRIAGADGVDRLMGASGEFGLDWRNPVPVNGPLGAITYLSRLKTHNGQRLLFQCVGGSNNVQVYEAATYSGSDWYVFFLDIYHPRKSNFIPSGFEFSGDVAMFSGFVDMSVDFPLDYQARVAQLDERLKPAYAPETRLDKHFSSVAYIRPLLHWAKLEALAARDLL